MSSEINMDDAEALLSFAASNGNFASTANNNNNNNEKENSDWTSTPEGTPPTVSESRREMEESTNEDASPNDDATSASNNNERKSHAFDEEEAPIYQIPKEGKFSKPCLNNQIGMPPSNQQQQQDGLRMRSNGAFLPPEHGSSEEQQPFCQPPKEGKFTETDVSLSYQAVIPPSKQQQQDDLHIRSNGAFRPGHGSSEEQQQPAGAVTESMVVTEASVQQQQQQQQQQPTEKPPSSVQEVAAPEPSAAASTGEAMDQDAAAPQNDGTQTSRTTRPRRAAAVRAEKQVAAQTDQMYNNNNETAASFIVTPPPDDEFYVEETAWRYYNPPMPMEDMEVPGAVAPQDLQPLGPAPPLGEFPNTGKCKWSFNVKTRVLLADFIQDNGAVELLYEDEKFLLEMMERDDITCVSDGLARGLDPALYDLANIVDACGDEFFHKFRRFDQETPGNAGKKKGKPNKKKEKVSGEEERQGQSATAGEATSVRQNGEAPSSLDMVELAETVVTCKYQETDGLLSMKVTEFARYLSMRQDALKRMEDRDAEVGGADKTEFRFVDHNAKEHVVDVRKSVLYMIDFDVVKLLPKLHDALLNKFELPGCLPGGLHCMMNAISVNGRPFMGPNAYCTPPESFTQVHQDGHGTVDSGHLCLSGYNEVVMLRRMPERHKIHALSLLRGEGRQGAEYDGLYSEPHADQLGEKPDWPLVDGIEACERMNYYPSVFILKPGQLVHINKGRLHAFRKMSPIRLPARDCHFDLRSELLAELGTTNPEDFLCFSIAWDWMYRGVTSEGIYREVIATLECAILNRLRNRQSLAIPELALLQMARTMTPAESNPARMNPLCNNPSPVDHSKNDSGGYVPSTETVLRGILPGLRYVVNSHASVAHKAEAMANHSRTGPRVSIAKRPNSWENPQVFSLDPYGNSDFFCKLCSKELSNVYMHCDGCEVLLSKDFNICVDCHAEGRYQQVIQMHPLNPKRHSLINHTGNMKFNRESRCPCKNGPICQQCKYCAGCSCKCHQWFTLHRRFFNNEDENALVRRVEAVLEGDKPLRFSEEVQPRLDAAAGPVLPQISNDSICLPVKPNSQEKGDDDIVLPSADKQSTKRLASRARASERTSKKRGKNESGGNGAAAKKIRASQAGAASEWTISMVQSRLRSFDASQRPDDLRSSVCSPSQPFSCDDLSDGALAFTEPKGSLPPMDRCGKIFGFHSSNPEDLHAFLEKASELTERTPSAMIDLLPPTCDMTEADVRHLFRNFADTGSVRCDTRGGSIRLFYSLREVEIIMYGCLKGLKRKDYIRLMSYRASKSGTISGGCSKMCRDIEEWSVGLEKCAAYKKHLEDTVGLLYRLEGVEIPPTAPAPEQRQTQRQRATTKRRTVAVNTVLETKQEAKPAPEQRQTQRQRPTKKRRTLVADTVSETIQETKPAPEQRQTQRQRAMKKRRTVVVGTKKKVAQGRISTLNPNNSVTWNEEMLRPLLKTFEVDQRPDNIRPSSGTATTPTSPFDLSDSALAFSEPKGSFPAIRRAAAISGFEQGGYLALSDFLEKARKLKRRTPSAMLGLLPVNCNMSENDIRHLFRNFADSVEIRGESFGTTGRPITIAFSPREVEIMLYAGLKDLTVEKRLVLMPYRRESTLTRFHKDALTWTELLRTCDAYVQHLEETVGLLFRLEDEVARPKDDKGEPSGPTGEQCLALKI